MIEANDKDFFVRSVFLNIISRYFEKRKKTDVLAKIIDELEEDYCKFRRYTKTGVNKVKYNFFIELLRLAEQRSGDPDFYGNFSLTSHEFGLSELYEGLYLGAEIWRMEGGSGLRDFLKKIHKRKDTNHDLIEFIIALSDKTENIITPSYRMIPDSSDVILTYKYNQNLIPGEELCKSSIAILKNLLLYVNGNAPQIEVEELSCGADKTGSECIYVLKFPENNTWTKKHREKDIKMLDSANNFVFVGKAENSNIKGLSKIFHSEKEAIAEIGFLEWVMQNPEFAENFPTPRLIAYDAHIGLSEEKDPRTYFCLEERIKGPTLDELFFILHKRNESYSDELNIEFGKADMGSIAFAHSQARTGELKNFLDSLKEKGVIIYNKYDEGLKEIFYEHLSQFGIKIPEKLKNDLDSAFSEINTFLYSLSNSPSLDTSADNSRIDRDKTYTSLFGDPDALKYILAEGKLDFVLDYIKKKYRDDL